MAGLNPPSLGRMRNVFSSRYGALWIAVFVNLILAVLYIWSRGGGVVHLRIESDGSRYTASVDGREIASPTFNAAAEKSSVRFGIVADDLVPSLPSPSGLESVRITEGAAGDVVFEDTFEDWRPDVWTVIGGDPSVHNNVLASGSAYASVEADVGAWDGRTLEAEFRNPTTLSIQIRSGPETLLFQIAPFDTYHSRIQHYTSGNLVRQSDGSQLELDRTETVKSIAAMLLRPYPVSLAIVVGFIVLAFAARLPTLDRRLVQAGELLAERASVFVVALSLAAFVLLWYLIYVVGEAMPHVPDSVSYIFQAKVFASFRVAAEVPSVPFGNFQVTAPSFIQVADGHWFSQYPFGHPLFLAGGQLFHAIWLMPPLLGAASVYLIYRVGDHVYGTAVGVLAAVLLAFSPFFQMTASNFMSHNTAVFVLLLALFLYVRPTKRALVSMFLSGACLGLLFNIRPLAAVAFMLPMGGLMAFDLLRATDRIARARSYAAFGAGAVLLLLAYFLYNFATTGDPATSGYALSGTYSSSSLGFGGDHSLAFALQNQRQLLAYLLLVANGWPLAIGLSFAALPFLLGTRHRWDYFAAASVISLTLAIMLFRNAAIMHGPRFLYETTPFLMLLTARGVEQLCQASTVAGGWLATRSGWDRPQASRGMVGLAAAGLIAGLIVYSAYGWMAGWHDAWPGTPSTPQKMSQLEGFNFADRRLLDQADEMELENALVLVEECQGWWCYGSVFWTNTPDLDGNLVWARRLNSETDLLVLDAFEGRSLYVADYDAGTIEPATRADIDPEAPPP
ncbi:MAG: glycosyltransferase family 39 protein [Chloroflexi bacterium]|nr:glycosyltransferase family 39 protein [Chloroflexota bacterium]